MEVKVIAFDDVRNRSIIRFILKPHKRMFLCPSLNGGIKRDLIFHDLPTMHVEILIQNEYFEFKHGFEIDDDVFCFSNMWGDFICGCGSWMDVARRHLKDPYRKNYVKTIDEHIDAAKKILGTYLQTVFPAQKFELIFSKFVNYNWQKIYERNENEYQIPINLDPSKYEKIANSLSSDAKCKLQLAALFGRLDVIKDIFSREFFDGFYNYANSMISIALFQEHTDCVEFMLKNFPDPKKMWFDTYLYYLPKKSIETLFQYFFFNDISNIDSAFVSLVADAFVNHLDTDASFDFVEKHRKYLGSNIINLFSESLMKNPKILKLIALSVKEDIVRLIAIDELFYSHRDVIKDSQQATLAKKYFDEEMARTNEN